MNYNLAKKLKESGFGNQIFPLGQFFYPSKDSIGWTSDACEKGVCIDGYVLEKHFGDLKSGYIIPSLSELIEACGEKFHSVVYSKTVYHKWHAMSSDPKISLGMGNSPKEAVANLWLELKKHG